MDKKEIKKAFMDTVTVMTGYLVLGIGFGIILKTKGFGVLWALAMSTVIYAGSMQFVARDLMTGGASLAVTALTTLMVNARHLFYGISMINEYKDTGSAKPYLIFSLTDETFSLVCDRELPDGVNRKKYFLTVSLLNQCYWVLGSFLGGFLGNVITFNTTGIDFSMTALFVVVFIEQWEQTKEHIPALLGLVCSLICLLIVGPDQFLIPTMICIPAGLFLLKSVIEKEGQSK